MVELDAVELREQAVPQHLDRDAGAVRDEEHGSATIGHEMGSEGLGSRCAEWTLSVK